uniref:Uncharacterized protein n=1 Tax=Timema monikensis TaxID=170555 RepID=A0A7R9HMG4_9NEOP|nr:unnamed protein product [Timema monikensis]
MMGIYKKKLSPKEIVNIFGEIESDNNLDSFESENDIIGDMSGSDSDVQLQPEKNDTNKRTPVLHFSCANGTFEPVVHSFDSQNSDLFKNIYYHELYAVYLFYLISQIC